MRKKLCFFMMVMCIAVVGTFSGCANGEKSLLDPKSPVAITLWHAYNSYAKDILDDLIVEFNETVGMEQGIIVESYSYGDTGKLDEALYNSSNNIIGAEPMPNIFLAYSDNAYRIDEVTPLVPLNKYFSRQELELYREEFLQEGVWGADNAPKMVPVAKSTEILYLDKTDWDKFVTESGLAGGNSEEALKLLDTWEGMLQTGEAYYKWSGGRAFLGFNSNNDFMGLTAAQMGLYPYIVEGDRVSFSYSEEAAKKIWEICYVPHIRGWYESSFYNQDGIKSGNLIAYIGSSAGGSFFPKEIMQEGGESYPITCKVLQYPTFEGAERLMSQRGANMSITAGNEKHEYASAVFLKWLTQPEQNIKFAVPSGYLPVENVALVQKKTMAEYVAENGENQAVRAGNKVILAAINDEKASFVAKRPFKNSYEINRIFYSSIFEKIETDLEEVSLRIKAGEAREKVIAEMESQENFEKWYGQMLTYIGKYTD